MLRIVFLCLQWYLPQGSGIPQGNETVQNPQAELANAAMGLELFRRVFSRQPHCGGTGQCSLQWRSDSEKSCHDSALHTSCARHPSHQGVPVFHTEGADPIGDEVSFSR